MDGTHKQFLKKGCCGQKMICQGRKKEGGKKQQISVGRFKENRRMYKDYVLCKSLLETKQEASGKRKELFLLCFLSSPSLTRRIRQCEKLGSFEIGTEDRICLLIAGVWDSL